MDSNNFPIFSVIIPTFQRVQLLQNSIQSVLNQSFEYFELIIVDDGSTDETSSFVHSLKDSRVRYIFQEKGERSMARNLGIQSARGKYICFLDDDDEYTPDFLTKFFQYYQKNNFPDTILRTGFSRNEGGKLKPTPNYNPKKHVHSVRFAAYHMCGIWTLCIPKEYLIHDRFHPDFPHWQDTHLILRLFAKYGMTQLEEYNYVYHIHATMGSKKMASDIEANLQLNILPIEHLFANYSTLLKPFLPTHTKRYLIAKKYLEFAHYDVVYGDKSRYKKFIKTSLQYYPSILFLKTYLILVRDLIKSI
ncbi:MAG: glycosyltransferase family 2 protein [Saprospiraceae bacterium]